LPGSANPHGNYVGVGRRNLARIRLHNTNGALCIPIPARSRPTQGEPDSALTSAQACAWGFGLSLTTICPGQPEDSEPILGLGSSGTLRTGELNRSA
jgi:hypothetical protein